EMEIPASRAFSLEISRTSEFEGGLVRGPEVRRAAEEPGNVLGQHIQHLARGVAAGDAFGIRWKGRQVAIPTRRHRAHLHLLDLGAELRELLTVVGKEPLPSAVRLSAPRANAGVKLLHDAVGYEELGILWPAISTLREPNLFLAQRFAMGSSGINLV